MREDNQSVCCEKRLDPSPGLASFGMGQTDIPLNERGREQARAAAVVLKNTDFKTIVASPLSRALETAQIIADIKEMPVTVIDDLKECSWGEKEGKSKGDGGLLEDWRNGQSVFQGGETFSAFCQRVIRGLNQALLNESPVLVVAHGGVYWAIQDVLKLPIQDLSNGVPYYHRPPQDSAHPWLVYELGEDEGA